MSSSTPPHYVKLKRYGVTIFVHCDVNHDTVQMIKERYEKLVGRTFYTVRLYHGRQNLEDASTLYNCGIESEGAELIVVYSKRLEPDEAGEYEWEDVETTMNPPPKEEPKTAGVEDESTADAPDNAKVTGENVATSAEENGLKFIEPNVDGIDV